MKITLTSNKFDPNPYYDIPLKAQTEKFTKILPKMIDTFDQTDLILRTLNVYMQKKMITSYVKSEHHTG